MTDVPVTDRYISYAATGGERVFDVDWFVPSAGDLTVQRTRAGVPVTLAVEVDYQIVGLGNGRGAQVVLTEPAVRADVFDIFGAEVVIDGGASGETYVLGQFVGDWQSGQPYRRGHGVAHRRGAYLCLLPHVSSAAFEPGAGVSWTTYWHQVAAPGEKGDPGVNAALTNNSITIPRLHKTVVDILADAAPPAAAYARGWTDWISAPAKTGTLAAAFSSGPVGRTDFAQTVSVTLASGTVASASEDEILNGANVAAVANADGGYEVFQFRTAALVSGTTYLLSRLLRGQGGTAAQMRNPVASGAAVLFRS